MKSSFYLLVLFTVCLFQIVRSHDDENENAPSDVVVLTDDNFDEEILNTDTIMVMFYAPWCGHCKKFGPELAIAATELKELVIKVAKIDCTAEDSKATCSSHGVNQYPTTKIFTLGVDKEYNGPRKAAGVVSYMKRLNRPFLTELNAKEVKAFSEIDEMVILGIFDAKNSTEYKLFRNIANKQKESYSFGAVIDAKVANEYIVPVPSVVIFKLKEEPTEYTGELKEAKLVEFLRAHSIPLLADIGSENYQQYNTAGIPLGYLFVSNDEEREEYGAFIRPLAKKLRGKMNFVFIDAVEYASHASGLNLEQSFPAFSMQDTVTQLKYPFDQNEDITAESLEAFVTDVLDGKVEPSYKSEPVPKKNNGPVKVIVFDQYDEIVNDAKKVVLLELYAPWCGHCKKLAPIFKELGKKYANDTDVIIAKMDATKNDLPKNAGYSVTGYPTLKLIEQGSNNVVDFSGERTLEAMANFIEKYRTKTEKVEDDYHDEL